MALWRSRIYRNGAGRGALLLAALLLCLGISGAPAAAQTFNPFNWFQQVFRPQPQRDYREYAPPRVHQHHNHAQTKTAPTPTVPPTFFVAVIGDSLGQLLAQGLTTGLSDRPEIAVLHDAKEDSGLVRDDYYDWPKAAHDLVTSGQKINVAVMMIGSNDHQTLHDSTGSYDPGTPQYNQIYAARIEAVAKAFHDAKIPLFWVGLPIMKNDRFSSQMAALNDLYRQYASKNGATFVDTWQDFVDDSGQFSSYGPDVDGQVVRLRALDGIHFTKAGALKLASFITPHIREIFNSAAPQGDAALAKIETTAPAGVNSPGAGGAGPPVKPPIGPVLPLTGPALAPGAQLATFSPGASKTDSGSLGEQTFVNGKESKSQTPKAGRADDFSWPRAELAVPQPPKPAPPSPAAVQGKTPPVPVPQATTIPPPQKTAPAAAAPP